MVQYEIVIGLEVHLELNTRSKIFCPCPNAFGDEPNTHVCPVCLGLPGVLPVLNQGALESAILAALALNCRINPYSKFDRKNYFYPDLPKAYQVSQYDFPVASGGYLVVGTGGNKRHIRINRVHLEEDAGKLVHAEGGDHSLVDYNRSGVPLVEIVTEPDIRSPEEARNFLESLKRVMQYTGVSDCKMEEGSLRCDANLSLRPRGEEKLGVKTELKNLNSFKAVQKGLEFEVERQRERLEQGRVIRQETLRWDEAAGKTLSLRGKEEAHDYRYFPEPDLVPMEISPGWVEDLKKGLPEMPGPKKERYIREYNLPEYDAGVLTASRDIAGFFEECVSHYKEPKVVSNWVMGDLSMLVNAAGGDFSSLKAGPADLACLLDLLKDGRVSGKMAKDILVEMCETGSKPQEIIEKKGLVQISDQAVLARVIQEVVEEHPGPADDYRHKKEKALGFLVGQVMRKTRGNANPQLVNRLLRERLRP